MLLLVGCAHVRSQPVTAVRYRPTEPWRIDIYEGNPQRSHLVVAKIVVSSSRGIERFDAEEQIREEAARYGADAVIVDKRPGFGPRDRGSYQGIYARAVRWTGPSASPVIDW